MKDTVRIICGNKFEDYEVNLSIHKQFRLKEVNSMLTGLPLENNIKYYVRITNGFETERYIFEGNKVYQIELQF